ncbi:hypothetical protein ACF05W_37315 [Streptomyces lydicus]|uniref:hypothetical protein n=1 Tax=Streptomyces lydicus TaxID=47763 RepID=UPI0037029B86
MRWQVERNRVALGRACLDTVFLHNPERTGDPAVLPIVLREAFATGLPAGSRLMSRSDEGSAASVGSGTLGGRSRRLDQAAIPPWNLRKVCDVLAPHHPS